MHWLQAKISGSSQHDGVDRIGVIRALYINLKAGRQTQGASTLTQQLARNAFHLKQEADKRGEGGLERKAVEAFLALCVLKNHTAKRKSSSFTSIAFLSAVASTASGRRLLVTLERSHVIFLRWSARHLWAASKTLPEFPRSIM